MPGGARGPRHAFLVGLVGTGIGPSLTPGAARARGRRAGLRYLYRRLDLDELGLPADGDRRRCCAAARLAGFDGLNITHPCKQLVLPHLDELSPDADALGAVNTVVFRGRPGDRAQHRLVRLRAAPSTAGCPTRRSTASSCSARAARARRSRTPC